MAFTQHNFVPTADYLTTENKPMTQQDYAQHAYRLIREKILPVAPANVIVSYGFPRAGKGNPAGSLGQCHTGAHINAAGKAAVIFIRPNQWTDPITVLDTLTHEAVHAALPGEGHKVKFKTLSHSIGLNQGKPKNLSAGPELIERLNAIAYQIGEFPSAAFDYDDQKKQTTRLRLYQCQCDPEEAKAESRTTKIRCASDNMDMTCNLCEAKFEIKEKE